MYILKKNLEKTEGKEDKVGIYRKLLAGLGGAIVIIMAAACKC